jgi:hypothetical protein
MTMSRPLLLHVLALQGFMSVWANVCFPPKADIGNQAGQSVETGMIAAYFGSRATSSADFARKSRSVGDVFDLSSLKVDGGHSAS